MDVLPPQAQNRASNLSLTSLFFLLQKPLHLPCQFALYNSSIPDPKAASELKFSPYSLHNLPKIGYLFSPHSQINSLFSCYGQKASATILSLACQYRLEEGGDVALTGRMNYSSKKKKIITALLVTSGMIHYKAFLSSSAVKYLPRLSPCFCC